MKKPLYQHLASTLHAYHNCANGFGHRDWAPKHLDRLRAFMSFLPSGSGFDTGTEIDVDKSDGRSRIVLKTSYHHMDQNGMYCGWSEHTVTVKPAFDSFTMRIVTHRGQGIRTDTCWREYAEEVFDAALRQQVEE